MRQLAAFVVLLGGAGCGVYSVGLDPPPARVGAPSADPLDLGVSLGEIRSFANGWPEAVDPATASAIDVDFVRAVERSGLFRQVLPHGRRADVYVDTVRELHAAPMTAGRTAYLLAVAPFVILVPGFPHPWDYHVTRTVKLRGDVDGTSIPLADHELVYDERVWGANYWGGLATDPLRASEGDYLAAAVREVIDASRPDFTRFAAAARAGDVEQAWLTSIEARLPAR